MRGPELQPDAVWEGFKRAWGPLNVSVLQRMATPEEIARLGMYLPGRSDHLFTGGTRRRPMS